MNAIAALVGRVMLALLFIVSGLEKLFAVQATEALITGAGLPSGLAVAVGLFEFAGGLAIAFGVVTRLFALLLSAYCLMTILFFHHDFTDPGQATQALKDLAIAGGLLCLFAHAQVRWSYDSLRLSRRQEMAARAAEERAHAATVRAARAEGRADVLGTVTATPVTVGSAGTLAPAAAPERARRWWDWR